MLFRRKQTPNSYKTGIKKHSCFPINKGPDALTRTCFKAVLGPEKQFDITVYCNDK